MNNGWYALGLLLAACAGAAGKQHVMPTAGATPNAQKWEHLCYIDKLPEQVAGRAERAGPDGYEMVAGTYDAHSRKFVFCFKRPM